MSETSTKKIQLTQEIETSASLLSPLTIGLLILAALLIVAMVGLGISLLGQVSDIEDNEELSGILVDFSERPYTSVQRDTLRLAIMIENEESNINDIRNLRAIITNHMAKLTSPTQIRIRTDEVNAATLALQTRWGEETQNSITDYISAPVQDEAERRDVIAALEDFERDLNAISLQNERDRQARAAELDDNTGDVLDTMRDILAGLAATGALLVLFGAGVASSIARSSRQVVALNNVLDQRVRDRTRDLQTATDVSQQVAALLNTNELVKSVSNQTINSYGLEAILIGLVDDEKQEISIISSIKRDGKPLVFDDTVKIGLEARPSIIARAARERSSVMVPDVTASSDYLSLGTLPTVKAEAAIPMVVGDKVVGVFDLYADNADRFSADTLNALRIVANQTAVAVQNANLFADVTRARQEAETSNKVKSQFLAAMSHELRTPMNSILNFTQFVSSGMLGDVTAEQKDALDKSYASGEHLLNLINDVLDISKIESDALQLYVERDIDLAEVLGAVSDMGESLAKGQPIAFSIQQPSELPRIIGDKQRIRQIILNLVSNAIKFTTEGRVDVIAEQANDCIRIMVKDTGPGIPEIQHEKIFELFSQTQVGLRKGGGTGLGLPIARRLAQAHEGTLDVASEVGKGSTFTVTLPIKPPSLEKILREQEAEEA